MHDVDAFQVGSTCFLRQVHQFTVFCVQFLKHRLNGELLVGPRRQLLHLDVLPTRRVRRVFMEHVPSTRDLEAIEFDAEFQVLNRVLQLPLKLPGRRSGSRQVLRRAKHGAHWRPHQ